MAQMDGTLYRKYLREYVQLAVRNSDGTARGIYESLAEIQISGLFTRHKLERRRALDDARRAFDEHRHWPVEIILRHLGLD